MDEASVATEYRKQHPQIVTSELPVGHLSLAELSDNSVSDRVTQLSLRADLYAPSDQTLTLVECKRSLNVRAIGQLLTYARLFDTDRELLRTRFRQRCGLDPYPEDVIAPHTNSNGSEQSVRPVIDHLDLRIAVNELPSKARNGLLRACEYHGIAVDYFEHGGWTRLTDQVSIDRTVKPTVSPGSRTYNQQYTSLAEQASPEVQSDTEEEVLRRMGLDDVDGHTFREIPLTGNDSAEVGGIRADVIVLPESEGPLYAIELKDGTGHGGNARSYYTGVGQSLCAAALCELELNIRTVPILGFGSLPAIGGYLTIDTPTGIPWGEIWPTVHGGAE